MNARTVTYNASFDNLRPVQVKLGEDLPEKLLVVTHPTSEESTLADVLHETDYLSLMIQCRGGLKTDDIAGIYAPHQLYLAEKHAKQLMRDHHLIAAIYGDDSPPPSPRFVD